MGNSQHHKCKTIKENFTIPNIITDIDIIEETIIKETKNLSIFQIEQKQDMDTCTEIIEDKE